MKRSKIISYLMPNFNNIVWLVTFFGVLLRGRNMMNGDGDLARHLTVGKYILDHGQVPLIDLFSHTMQGEVLTPYEWLSQITFALINRFFGLNGVIIFSALIISITFYLLFKWTRSLCKTLFIPLMVIFLAILTASSHWLSRPHIFTFLFLTLWIIILNNLYQGKSNRWWLLPILMLFWVNFHGGFLAGFFTWFAYGVGIGWDTIREKRPENKFLPPYFWRNYLLGGVSSFIVSFIHPSGIDLWRIVVGHIGNNYIMDITDEFKSPNFHLSFTWPFLIFLILLLITLAYSKKKINSARLFSSLI